MEEFLRPEGICPFLFVVAVGAENLAMSLEPPTADKMKKKILLVLRARTPTKNEPITIDASNAEKELVFMELNKNILENMYLLCNEVYMPVMSNPLNMAGWSDLVSKDLMDKFHGFLAHLYVTIGLVNRKTLLPLPPNDVTSSEKTSSKDKS